MKNRILFACIFLVAISLASAQDMPAFGKPGSHGKPGGSENTGGPGMEMESPEKMAQHDLSRVMEKIAVEDSIRIKIGKVLRSFHEDLAFLRTNDKLTPENMTGLVTQRDSRACKLLNEEDCQMFKDILVQEQIGPASSKPMHKRAGHSGSGMR